MGTARRTAAALGILAFVYVGAAGVVQQASAEWTLTRALIALAAFAAFGWVVGLIGAAVARDAAAGERRRKIDAARAAQKHHAAPGDAGANPSGEPPAQM